MHGKEHFYSQLNMEDITDADIRTRKRAWNGFKIKNLSEYRDLYDQNNTLVDVFENF